MKIQGFNKVFNTVRWPRNWCAKLMCCFVFSCPITIPPNTTVQVAVPVIAGKWFLAYFLWFVSVSIAWWQLHKSDKWCIMGSCIYFTLLLVGTHFVIIWSRMLKMIIWQNSQCALNETLALPWQDCQINIWSFSDIWWTTEAIATSQDKVLHVILVFVYTKHKFDNGHF